MTVRKREHGLGLRVDRDCDFYCSTGLYSRFRPDAGSHFVWNRKSKNGCSVLLFAGIFTFCGSGSTWGRESSDSDVCDDDFLVRDSCGSSNCSFCADPVYCGSLLDLSADLDIKFHCFFHLLQKSKLALFFLEEDRIKSFGFFMFLMGK